MKGHRVGLLRKPIGLQGEPSAFGIRLTYEPGTEGNEETGSVGPANLQQIVRGGIIALAVIYDIQSKSRRESRKLGTITAARRG